MQDEYAQQYPRAEKRNFPKCKHLPWRNEFVVCRRRYTSIFLRTLTRLMLQSIVLLRELLNLLLQIHHPRLAR